MMVKRERNVLNPWLNLKPTLCHWDIDNVIGRIKLRFEKNPIQNQNIFVLQQYIVVCFSYSKFIAFKVECFIAQCPSRGE